MTKDSHHAFSLPCFMAMSALGSLVVIKIVVEKIRSML